jgi:hypothetical protein
MLRFRTILSPQCPKSQMQRPILLRKQSLGSLAKDLMCPKPLAQARGRIDPLAWQTRSLRSQQTLPGAQALEKGRQEQRHKDRDQRNKPRSLRGRGRLLLLWFKKSLAGRKARSRQPDGAAHALPAHVQRCPPRANGRADAALAEVQPHTWRESDRSPKPPRHCCQLSARWLIDATA